MQGNWLVDHAIFVRKDCTLGTCAYCEGLVQTDEYAWEIGNELYHEDCLDRLTLTELMDVIGGTRVAPTY